MAAIFFILTGITPGDVSIHIIDQKNNLINIFSMLKIHKFVANNIFYFAFPSAIVYSYLIYKSNIMIPNPLEPPKLKIDLGGGKIFANF